MTVDDETIYSAAVDLGVDFLFELVEIDPRYAVFMVDDAEETFEFGAGGEVRIVRDLEFLDDLDLVHAIVRVGDCVEGVGRKGLVKTGGNGGNVLEECFHFAGLR